MPRDDPPALWALQGKLLLIAQSILGSRDPLKKIYQPQFADNGPNIRNTPNLDGAFVELSRNAEGHWPTVVYEMAHETVHLLNPGPGNTNNLEEGVAVAFSIHVQPSFGICIPTLDPSYLCVFQLGSVLSGGALEAGRRVRDCFGALSAPTAQELQELFPNVDTIILRKLALRFMRRGMGGASTFLAD